MKSYFKKKKKENKRKMNSKKVNSKNVSMQMFTEPLSDTDVK